MLRSLCVSTYELGIFLNRFFACGYAQSMTSCSVNIALDGLRIVIFLYDVFPICVSGNVNTLLFTADADEPTTSLGQLIFTLV